MLSKNVQLVIRDALMEAHRRRHDLLTVEHVLFALTNSMKGRIILEGSGASVPVLREQLEEFFSKELETVSLAEKHEVAQTDSVQRVLERALEHIRSAGRDAVELGDLLISIMDEEESYAHFYLRKQGVERLDVLTFISHGFDEGAGSRGVEAGAESAENGEAKADPLAQYTVELTARAREGKIDPLVGRVAELDRAVEVLCRRRKNNPLFVGDPGVGKTALAEGLALRIAERNVPYKLLDKEVYLLDLTSLVAGTQFRGQFESRMKGLIEEIKKLGNIILVIDEVHNLVGAGDAEGSMSAANILKPALSRGEIQVIGATTLTEYRKYIEKDSALERRFQPVMVDEPSLEDSVAILKGIAPYYENYHHVTISPEMCRLAVTMSERYITDRFLPDKAIDLIDEASSDVNLHNKALTRVMQIDKELADIAKEREVMLAAANDKSGEAFDKLRRRETTLLQQKEKLDSTPNDAEPELRQAKLTELQQQLNLVAQEKSNLERANSERAYQRLAVLKSQELQLSAEKDGLADQCTPALTVENLARVIELWTKIPASQIQEREYQRLARLEERESAEERREKVARIRERLTPEERIQIITALEQGGIFLLKGAVKDVSAALGGSQASVYRYLSQIRREGPDGLQTEQEDEEAAQ